jgi:HEAT repeat protein
MRTLRWVLGLLLCAGVTAQAADIDALVKQLKDKDADVRRKAVQELSEAGKDAQSATPALVQALKDNDLFVRRFAAQALGEIEADPKVAAKPLADVLKDPKEKKEVKAAVAGSLGRMGAAGVAPLTAAVKDDATDTDVRRRAVEALGKIGPDAKPSLPALVAVLKMVPGGKKKNTDKDADLRIEAATALGHIASASDKDALEALRDLGSGKNLKQNKGLGDAIKKAVQEIEMRK